MLHPDTQLTQRQFNAGLSQLESEQNSRPPGLQFIACMLNQDIAKRGLAGINASQRETVLRAYKRSPHYQKEFDEKSSRGISNA